MGVGCRPARAPERPIGSVPPESSGAMAIIRPRGLQHPRGAKAVAKMLPTLANRETHPAGAEEPVVTERRSLKSVHGGLAKVGATPGAPKAAEWRSGRLRPPKTGVAPTFCPSQRATHAEPGSVCELLRLGRRHPDSDPDLPPD
jgi:hypothetical protein